MIDDVIEPFKLPALERISKIVGDYFTGFEITGLFKKSGYPEMVHDGSTKWRFLCSTFENLQKRKFGPYIILKFLETTCDPQEYFGKPESHIAILHKLNDVLSFYGMKINEKGKVIKIKEKRDTIAMTPKNDPDSSLSKPFDPKEIEKEVRKAKEDAIPRMIVTTDTDSFAPGHKPIPKHNPPKQKPPLSKNQKIELGSFLGVAAIIITILLSPIPVFAQQSDLAFGKLITYYNPEYDFSILYPENWYVDDIVIDLPLSPLFAEGGDSIVLISDKKDLITHSIEITFVKNANIAKYNTGQEYLDKLVSHLTEFCEFATFESEGFRCFNHSIINSEITTVNGRQAYQVTEKWTQRFSDGTERKIIGIFTDIVDGNDVWAVDFLTPESTYPTFSGSLDKIIHSFTISASAQPSIPPPPPSTPTDDAFPIELVAIAIVIVAVVGIGIGLSKRKKVAPVISAPPAKAQVRKSRDDTQFWVCPNCGNNTQMKDERQYCPSCKIYLSI